MANNHAVFISKLCASWDVDSYRLAGIAPADIDNGVVVTLGAMALANANGGYEYNVAVASDATGKMYIVDTPIPGTGFNLEAQFYADPRYFYNIQGQPISLRKLVDGDHIELTAEGFTGAVPTVNAKVTVGAGGKFVVGAGAFTCVAIENIAIGQDTVPAYILRYDA